MYPAGRDWSASHFVAGGPRVGWPRSPVGAARRRVSPPQLTRNRTLIAIYEVQGQKWLVSSMNNVPNVVSVARKGKKIEKFGVKLGIAENEAQTPCPMGNKRKQRDRKIIAKARRCSQKARSSCLCLQFQHTLQSSHPRARGVQSRDFGRTCRGRHRRLGGC